MKLSKIKIHNYRLLIDAELDVDEKTTLIVGRNNTAKTSCLDFIYKVINNHPLTYNDYPLSKRKELHNFIAEFMSHTITYEKLCEQIPVMSIEFWVDYSLDAPDSHLGALSPFIIDVDEDITTAIILVENKFKISAEGLQTLLEPCLLSNSKEYDLAEARDIITTNFSKLFNTVIYAVNPKDTTNRQMKSQSELLELFPLFSIPAERTLGEDDSKKANSLTELISSFFDVEEEDLDGSIADEVKNLRKIIADTNKTVQKQSNDLLSSVVNSAIGFGYPNEEEMELSVETQLKIDDQIKNQTILTYKSKTESETLPNSYNGLGYKNLIKIEFLLAAFAKKIKTVGTACIPLLFIEEPESHMHPQMQQNFANYLESFIAKITSVHIQTFLTSHSAHIANTICFSKIRYAQKTSSGVIYKNLNEFVKEQPENIEFIRKYLTLNRCDLFFADKVILIEGASERLLLPDMIEKCEKAGLFNLRTYKLPAQYYTLMEVGGAYAYKFIPFINFLGIPCLILTDIDSVCDKNTKAVVSKGTTTSNATLKRWVREIKHLPKQTKIKLEDVQTLTAQEKTDKKCHIEFQVKEDGLCGRSLEEAIKNVNRAHYGLSDEATEEDLTFSEKSKTEFALNLIYQHPDYKVPKYIQDGLVWLNDEMVLS